MSEPKPADRADRMDDVPGAGMSGLAAHPHVGRIADERVRAPANHAGHSRLVVAAALTSITHSGRVKPMRFGGLIAKRWPVVGGALLVAAAGWAGWRVVRPRLPETPAPVYEGKPLSYWYTNARRFGGGPPAGIINDSNAVPFVIKALRRDSWIGAACYRKWLWTNLPPSIQRRLPTPTADKPEIRQRALELLAHIGPVARPVVPAVVMALKQDEDNGVRAFAAQALGTIGKGDKTAIAALVRALKDTDPETRYLATNALLRLDPAAAAKAGVKLPSP
jgi:hypothetical protein